MPSKSRSTRGKQPHKSRKSKAKQRQGVITAKSETSSLPVTRDEKEKPQAAEPVQHPSRTRTMVYPHVTEELKRIGILAAIIFIILIILAIVIP
jgi:preprotein translocase subunit SecF